MPSDNLTYQLLLSRLYGTKANLSWNRVSICRSILGTARSVWSWRPVAYWRKVHLLYYRLLSCWMASCFVANGHGRYLWGVIPQVAVLVPVEKGLIVSVVSTLCQKSKQTSLALHPRPVPPFSTSSADCSVVLMPIIWRFKQSSLSCFASYVVTRFMTFGRCTEFSLQDMLNFTFKLLWVFLFFALSVPKMVSS